MGTAERREAPDDGGAAARSTVRESPRASDRDIPAVRSEAFRGAGEKAASVIDEAGEEEEFEEVPERIAYRPLWVEEPAKRHRMPDPVRTAAVRAVLIIAVTLIQAMVAFLCTLAGSWLAFPMVLSGVASTVVATWAVLDVWVTRQVWKQRNGVISTPASTARALRRERRRVRRQERAAQRAHERIRRRGGAGQLSHP
ncbi:hypothetical protein QNN03_27610 [Streptomyces sp. GXMU-J15]|uniref:DUF3040 domain-containing protein n=1 Tax=Streptomyces fuscus TaxID=3048495 RepID=A0ABT7J744_9ACTN|nr:hypothetical protein [Streptomyces fuscus]MDL2080216.1 hypothetical protein [Streptomyces fuscus]